MAEPDELVLEILRSNRAELRRRCRRVAARLISLRARVGLLGGKLDGLGYAVASSVESMGRELKDVGWRLAMLEAAQA